MAEAHMILCDTNIIIETFKGNPDVIKILRKFDPPQLAVSVITVAEL